MGIIPKWMKFASGGYDSITQAYINGMTTKPTTAHCLLIDQFVRNNKNLINKADVLYLGNINNSNDSFRNLAKNAHHGTIQGSGLVFDPYWGFRNPDGTGWVDTNYNPATQGVNYTLNDAGIGVYVSGSQVNYVAYILVGLVGTSQLSKIRFGSTLGAAVISVNKDESNVPTGNPFNSGLFSSSRVSTSTFYNNQNIPRSTYTSTASRLPLSFMLFCTFDGNSPYLGALNFTYIGASLTDEEFTQLNNAVNDYLIQCLFLKYGHDNWGVKMAKSYFLELHNFEKYEAWEVYEFIKRHQLDYVDSAGTGYFYNTFGPNGQNKTVCDYIMLFKAGGNLVANAWTKTGATLRWNQDGAITSSNTMPAYTRGANLGIVTVTSTDGWNGVSAIVQNQALYSRNSFYGNYPQLNKIKTSGIHYFTIYQNNFKVQFSSDYNLISEINAYNMGTKSSLQLDILKMISSSVSAFRVSGLGILNYMLDASSIINQLIGLVSLEGTATQRQTNLTGTLQNLVIADTITYFVITYSDISGGTSIWNKNLATFSLLNCRLNTSAVDAQLAVGDNYYVGAVVPIKVQSVNLSGATMGIPTGGANNLNLLSWVAKGAAVGFPPVITVRTT